MTFFIVGIKRAEFFLVLYHVLKSKILYHLLIVYASYQLSFIMGGYLARAETHFAKKSHIMGWMDIAKQQGYLTGLAFSYGFYKLLEYQRIIQAVEQVYYLHYILLFIEIVIILSLFRAFRAVK